MSVRTWRGRVVRRKGRVSGLKDLGFKGLGFKGLGVLGCTGYGFRI